MTTPNVNILLQRDTHPQRKPYVRDRTFIDDLGPPPYGFFDETQDHLGGQLHAALGWKESSDSDEFTELTAPSGYFGRMLITRSFGTLTVGAVAAAETGEHGIWGLSSDANFWNWTMQGGWLTLDGDFLLTCKVKLLYVEEFDAAEDGGFIMGAGHRYGTPQAPGFAAGGDKDVWRIVYAPDAAGVLTLADTDVPLVNDRWYRLQVSRVAGALRWFINGHLCRLNGMDGLYYPARILNAAKFIEAARMNTGSAGAGFKIDSFHLRAQRTIV